jgi:hypothetical protein
MPASLSALGIASTGPMPMISGGTPATAKLQKRAIGTTVELLERLFRHQQHRPRRPTSARLLPAVTEPGVRTPASAWPGSAPSSARGPFVVLGQALAMRTCRSSGRADTRHQIGRDLVLEMAGIDRRTGLLVRLRTAKASCSSRLTFHCCATFSAVRPMPKAMARFSSWAKTPG